MNAELLTYINQFAQQYGYDALITSGVLSPLLQMLKNWLAIEGSKTYKVGPLKIQGEQIMFILILLSVVAMTLAQRALHMPTSNHTILAVQAAVTAFMLQPVYLFIFKPMLRAYSNAVENQVQQRVNALNLAPAPIEAPVAPVAVPVVNDVTVSPAAPATVTVTPSGSNQTFSN